MGWDGMIFSLTESCIITERIITNNNSFVNAFLKSGSKCIALNACISTLRLLISNPFPGISE